MTLPAALPAALPAFAISAPLAALGIAVLGIGLGQAMQRLLKSAQANSGAAWCEHIALRLLLPMVVFESLRHVSWTAALALPVLLGALIPMLLWLPARLSGLWQEAALLACTFGGGNRGVALIGLAFAGSAALPDALRSFVLLDFGNLLCMLLVLPWLWERAWPRRAVGINRLRLSVLLKSPALSVLGVGLLCAVLANAWPGFDDLLAQSAGARKWLLSALVFVAVGIKLPPIWRTASWHFANAPWGCVAALRGIGLVGVGMAWAMDQDPLLCAAATVLLVLPPSSLLPALMAPLPLAEDRKRALVQAVAQSNVLYLFALAAAATIALFAP